MSFFSMGDRVTIRRDIEAKLYKMREGSRNGILAYRSILKSAGQSVVIISVNESYPVYYTVQTADGSIETAADEMFQEYVDFQNGVQPCAEFEPPTAAQLLAILS